MLRNKMLYTQFIEYLNLRKINYTEKTRVDIDYWMEEYVTVTPLKTNLKERYFSTDGGWQLVYK